MVIADQNQLDCWGCMPLVYNQNNFRLFNKNENRFSGDTIITRQLLKMNVAYRSGLNNKQQHDAISDFLNAAFRGIQAVNLELNLFTLNE